MKIIDVANVEAKLIKKLLAGAIARPIALISSLNEDGSVNVAPFSYFNIVNHNPAVVSVSILRNENGMLKDTARNLMAGRSAIVHVVTSRMVEQANNSAISLQYGQTEASYAGIEWQIVEKDKAPLIKGSMFALEVQHLANYPLTKDEQVSSELFLLAIKKIFVEEETVDPIRDYVIYDELKAVTKLAGNDYAEMGHVFQERRPD